MSFQQKLLGKAYCFVKMTAPDMVLPASSDFLSLKIWVPVPCREPSAVQITVCFPGNGIDNNLHFSASTLKSHGITLAVIR